MFLLTSTMSLGKFLADTSATETSIFDLSNWELVKSIDSFNQSITNFSNNTKSFFDAIKVIQKYLTHPMLIWNGFIAISFWCCLIICLSSFLIYLMTNRRKDLDKSKYAFAVWIILKILDMSIKSI